MKPKRPVNLDLGTLKYPPMAIASILHRLSGVLLFVLSPLMLYFFDLSTHSAETFEHMVLIKSTSWGKLFLWVFSAALVYHLLAGIRHLLMDVGLGERLETGRLTAILVLLCSAACIIFLGIWLW